ncbi:response regulator [Piscinibacter sp. HJYY11]|uniref:response regulator n=1 Tax=Piscinibacter sp. HJYY11 TaxID=2801333 RepID=UPI00191CA4C0|nr:response regulator [Piscinibacter sp. HJYY11]MBL0728293.1 response regulator [Piscinibacter sp. HJYY11]
MDDLRVSGPEPQGTVLYIEDQDLNFLLVQAQLAATLPGIHLIRAATGAEGVEKVRSERPQLVLLDMHLPDTGGLEVVRALNVEISQGLKVALLTADHLSMDILKAMSLGAYEYWVKPISATQLEKGVRRGLAAAGGIDPVTGARRNGASQGGSASRY